MKFSNSMLATLLSFLLLGTGVVGANALNSPHAPSPPTAANAPGAATPAVKSSPSATCQADEAHGNDKPEVNAQGTPEASDQGTQDANESPNGADKEDVQGQQDTQERDTGANENTASDSDNLQCGDQHEDAQAQTTTGTPAATPHPKR